MNNRWQVGQRVRYNGGGGYSFANELRGCEGVVTGVIGTDVEVRFDRNADCEPLSPEPVWAIQAQYLEPARCP